MPNGNKPGQPPKYRNISVDADIVDVINAKAAVLEETFGFKPTISQTLRYILKKETNQ
jgi:hypothetical protein